MIYRFPFYTLYYVNIMMYSQRPNKRDKFSYPKGIKNIHLQTQFSD